GQAPSAPEKGRIWSDDLVPLVVTMCTGNWEDEGNRKLLRLSPGPLSLVPRSELVLTHHQELELEQTATLTDIKKAYRRLAVIHHPDRNIGREEEATVKQRALNEAYEILSDESSRGGQQRREQRRHESSLSEHLRLLLGYLQRNGWTIVFMLTGSVSSGRRAKPPGEGFGPFGSSRDQCFARLSIEPLGNARTLLRPLFPRSTMSTGTAMDPDRVAVLGSDMRRVRAGQQAAAAERALAAKEKRIARAKVERERKRVRMLSILAPRQVPR
ncbi:hypothetical protein THAOC_05754, partial [Thalassiosira oceanica]